MVAPSSPLIKQSWMRVLLLLLGFIICSVLAGAIANFLVQGAALSRQGQLPPPEKMLRFVFVTICFSSLFNIPLTVIFRRYVDRQPIASLGFQWKSFQPDALIGFLLGLALPGMATLILFATGRLEWSELHFIAGDLFTGLALMIMIAFTEEIVFRGYMLTNLLGSLPPKAALGISAALFAFAHGTNPGITTLAIVNLLLAGLLLGINFIYTRNLWFAICFHFSWNFFQGPVLGYEVSGIPLQSVLQPALKGAWWLTGGPFGLEGSLVAALLFLLSVVLLYVAYERRKS